MNRILVATTAVMVAAVMVLSAVAMPAMATGRADPPEPPTDIAPTEACAGLAEALAQAQASGDAAAVAAIEAVRAVAGC